MEQGPPGRRERKKAQTRQALADAAMRLFDERGFDAVTVAEVAEAADVSLSTLFKHFPSKEALVFPSVEALEEGFTAAVHDRPDGASALEALQDLLIGLPARGDGPSPEQIALVGRTPALINHLEHRWARHADALATALAQDAGHDKPDAATRALARYVVLVPSVTRTSPDREQAIRDIFARLQHGWEPR